MFYQMPILSKTKGNKIDNSLQVTPKKSLRLPDTSFPKTAFPTWFPVSLIENNVLMIEDYQ